MIPISFVPHDPDHSGVFWTEKPHPLPEVIMSKETGMPLVVGPSSPPSDGGYPNIDAARQFHVSQSMVHHWVQHAQGQRLDRVDGHDRSHAPGAPHRTEAGIEELVLTVRAELEHLSDLGFHGAEAIHEALKGRTI